jgi:hypothetical protein
MTTDDNDPAFSKDVFKTVDVLEHVLQQCSGDPNVDLNALLMMVTSFGLHQIHEFGMERQAFIDMVVKQINHLIDNARVARDPNQLN